MSDLLDDILIEQWDAAQRSKKLFVIYKKLFPHEAFVHASEQQLTARIQFIEIMIVDKGKLSAKRKRKRTVAVDVLTANPVYEWWRNYLFLTVLGSRIFFKFAVSYFVSFVGTGQNTKKD